MAGGEKRGGVPKPPLSPNPSFKTSLISIQIQTRLCSVLRLNRDATFSGLPKPIARFHQPIKNKRASGKRDADARCAGSLVCRWERRTAFRLNSEQRKRRVYDEYLDPAVAAAR